MTHRFISSVKNIYDMLGDDLSRDIYINRLDYLITGEKRYVDSYVTANHPDIPVRNGEKEAAFLGLFPDGCNVVFYGMGRFVEHILQYLHGANISAFFMDSKSKNGVYAGYKVISINDALNMNDAYIVISTTKYYDDVKRILMNKGVDASRIIDIRGYFACGSGDEYFYEDFLDYTDKEIFIDAGCCDLESAVDLYRVCKKNLKKIYAFEPDPNNYRICCEKLERICKDFPDTRIYPYGTWDREEELHFDASHDGSAKIGNGDTIIKAVAIDDMVDKEDRITFIKMDVEGAELKSLEGAKRTIMKYRPKLAICIYHKPEDMLTLPEFIINLNLDYKLYIRSYSNAEHEVVMYAV